LCAQFLKTPSHEKGHFFGVHQTFETTTVSRLIVELFIIVSLT
jgi:hypothetical protein